MIDKTVAWGVAGVLSSGGLLYLINKYFFSGLTLPPPSGSAGSGTSSGYTKYTKPGWTSSLIKRNSFIAKLKSKKGKPYLWGHRGPDSFDCSGLVDWAYGELGIDVPPRVTEQSSEAPYSITFEAAHTLASIKHLLKRGDCVGLDYSFGDRYSHVIIYIGGSKFLQATGRETCPCADSRCKVVIDHIDHFGGENVRSIYSWV